TTMSTRTPRISPGQLGPRRERGTRTRTTPLHSVSTGLFPQQWSTNFVEVFSITQTLALTTLRRYSRTFRTLDGITQTWVIGLALSSQAPSFTPESTLTTQSSTLLTR